VTAIDGNAPQVVTAAAEGAAGNYFLTDGAGLLLLFPLAMPALRAISRRLSAESFLARAFPPFKPPSLPNSTAASFLALVEGAPHGAFLGTECSIS